MSLQFIMVQKEMCNLLSLCCTSGTAHVIYVRPTLIGLDLSFALLNNSYWTSGGLPLWAHHQVFERGRFKRECAQRSRDSEGNRLSGKIRLLGIASKIPLTQTKITKKWYLYWFFPEKCSRVSVLYSGHVKEPGLSCVVVPTVSFTIVSRLLDYLSSKINILNLLSFLVCNKLSTRRSGSSTQVPYTLNI